jgi:hypothetical protein
MAKYVVRSSAIYIEGGEDGFGKRCPIGTVVDLDAKYARHFVKIGRLDPYVPEDDAPEDEAPAPEDEDEDEDEVEDETPAPEPEPAPKPAPRRSRRKAS